MNKAQKQPNPVDIHVGRRIRERRNAQNMTQQQLAQQIGVTFQQIQKYEKGTNRVSASRLQEISEKLRVPVAYFYASEEEDAAIRENEENRRFAEDGASPLRPGGPCSAAEGNQLMRAFNQIRDPQVRRKIIDLAKALAGNAPSL